MLILHSPAITAIILAVGLVFLGALAGLRAKVPEGWPENNTPDEVQ